MKVAIIGMGRIAKGFATALAPKARADRVRAG
jgi:hypothetical protein